MSADAPQQNITRRRLLGWAGAAGAGLALGCPAPPGPPPTSRPAAAGTGGARPFAGRTLRVFVYSGAWEKAFREAFVPSFEARTGATVIVDPGWWDSIPKLKASPPGQPAFDLVLTDATQGYPAIREGMFQKLDLQKLPNLARVSRAALDTWVHRDGYGVTFPESAMTLAWNRRVVEPEPTGWGDLLREDVRGKVGLYNSFYMSLYTFACAKVAAEGREGQAAQELERDPDGVLSFAKEQRGRVKVWWPTSTDMALSLGQRTCAIGNMHSPDMLLAQRARPELGALAPAADRAFVLLMWVVPADTREAELATAAIDLLLSEEMQEAFARGGSATVLPHVAARVAQADPMWAAIYPADAAALEGVRYYPYDAYMRRWDEIVQVWDREVLRSS
ncbi:MAG: extracellular solute-binding protein [Planctomycetes bacterium]|nr:extracellular solute-binding protein [Planctomycetota bacterium]